MQLKIMRVKNDLTQAELARLIGVNQTLISKLEKKKVKPSVDTVYKLADALNVTPQEILACFYEKPQEVEV